VHALRAGAGFAGAAAAENEPAGPVRAAVGALGLAPVVVRETGKIGAEMLIPLLALRRQELRRRAQPERPSANSSI